MKMVHTTSLREQYLKTSTCAVVSSNFDINILFLKQLTWILDIFILFLKSWPTGSVVSSACFKGGVAFSKYWCTLMSKLRTLDREAWGRVPGGAAGGGGEGLVGYILAATRADSRLSCPLLIIQMFLWPGPQELCRLVANVRCPVEVTTPSTDNCPPTCSH